jgi:hypothetical protein
MTKSRIEPWSSHQIAVRLKLLKQIKSWVAGYVGPEHPAIEKYSEPFHKEFQGGWKVSSADDLFSAINNANIVFGADFHGFSQAQRTHLRVLRSMPSKKKVILALEIFQSKHQRFVDSYISGKISEEKFLECVEWEDKWGFPWKQYKPLLELAIKRRYKVLALNQYFGDRSSQTLKKRDLHAAHLIAKSADSDPEALIYAVYGELHVATKHIPSLVAKKLRNRVKYLVLFQDSERLYFSLARKGLEKKIQVMSRQNRFCILSSPPWVKWQSYLLFLEGSLDNDLRNQENEVDHTAHLNHLISILCLDLRLKINSKDIAVYGPVDEGLRFAMMKRLSRDEINLAMKLMAMGRSFFVPEGGIFYLANPTVNHAASLAGEYIQSRQSGRTRLLWKMPVDFRKLIWVEILSFYLSKLINHRRKTDRLQDIRVRAPLFGEEVLLLVLEEKVNALFAKIGKARAPLKKKPRRRASYLLAARLLGGLFGERLFLAYQSGFILKSDVIRWLSQDVDNDKFGDVYTGLIKKLESVPSWARQTEKRL